MKNSLDNESHFQRISYESQNAEMLKTTENPDLVNTNKTIINVDIQKSSQMFEEDLVDSEEDESKYDLILPEKYHGFIEPQHK